MKKVISLKKKMSPWHFWKHRKYFETSPKKSNKKITTKDDEICFQKTLLFVVGQITKVNKQPK